MLKHVSKQLPGQDYSKGLSLRVVRAALTLQQDYLLKKQKLPTAERKRVKAPAVRNNVCRLFGVSEQAFSTILGDYLADRTIFISGVDGNGRSGNRDRRQTRIPRTKTVQIMIREFVRGKRINRERVTAKEVLGKLVDEGILHIPHNEDGTFEEKAFESAYRNVRSWLQSCGYQRGKRTGNIIPNPELTVKRNDYLRQFFDNRSKPAESRLREVYLDESYIHEHYHRNDDSLWDPNDALDVREKKDPAKERRYCFAAAIQGPNPRVEEPRTDEDRAGLVPGSVWACCPQKKSDHHGDHHEVFNGTNFVKWWREKLLPNLKVPALIMIDNESYHRIYADHVPKLSSLTRAICIEYLKFKKVTFDERLTAVELKAMVREHIKLHEKIEIVRLSEEAGHKVLFTPPYHSDLQPIELIWAHIKDRVARKYSRASTLALVFERLQLEFQELSTNGEETVNSAIEHCVKVAHDFYDRMEQDDDEDEDDEPEDLGDDGAMDVNDDLGAQGDEDEDNMDFGDDSLISFAA
jgi:transposase